MGLLDHPATLFSLVDDTLAGVVSETARLVLWGIAAGVLSVGLYALVSPQAKIAVAKRRAVRARQQLNAYDGDFGGAFPLIRAQLRAAFQHVGLVLPATLVASVPLLALLFWLESSYGYDLPGEDAPPQIMVCPSTFEGRWEAGTDGPRVQVRDPDGGVLADVPVWRPVPRVEKRRWWNRLTENPLGYLPEDSPVVLVKIELPTRTYLDFGPEWTRSWWAIFFPSLLFGSLAAYRLARVE